LLARRGCHGRILAHAPIISNEVLSLTR
jgi:hypothetical protein